MMRQATVDAGLSSVSIINHSKNTELYSHAVEQLRQDSCGNKKNIAD